MTLKEILQTKPTKMITCKPTCLIIDAVTVMDGHNVGSILILDERDKLVGIFTERDLMHCFAKSIPIRDEKMANVMTHDPIALDSSEDISAALSIMSEKKIRHMPVIENGKVAGVVSYRYIISQILPDVLFMTDDIC